MVKKHSLYGIAGLVWGVPGVIITSKGIGAYMDISASWWLLAITIGVAIGFYFIFRGIVSRYIIHISALPNKAHPLRTFPLRGWLIIIFMMGLGIALKHVPTIPLQFTAAFYSGLGPMLLFSALRFFSAPTKK